MIFTIILGIASIFFFYQGSFFIAVVLLGWALIRVFAKFLGYTFNNFRPLIQNLKLERQVNCIVEVKFNIEEILKHPVFDDAFSKLKDAKNKRHLFAFHDEYAAIEKAASKDDWLALILKNYKEKYHQEYAWGSVRFNVKNGLLWKDEKVQYDDVICHDIFIPYILKDEKDIFHTGIGSGLTIRILVANGILKLQVGDFEKGVSPRILREGSLAIYEKYATMTSFPLMYFPFEHELPEKFLNLSYQYLESFHAEKGTKKWGEEWRALMQEVKDYNYLCEVAHAENADSKWQAMLKKFQEKREAWIKKEGFEDPNAKRKGESYDYFDSEFDHGRTNYVNKYMIIYIADLNEIKEKMEKYTYNDYYRHYSI